MSSYRDSPNKKARTLRITIPRSIEVIDCNSAASAGTISNELTPSSGQCC
jgi:hypothetical protein